MFGHQDNQPTETSDQSTTTDSPQTDTAAAVTDQSHTDDQGATPSTTPDPIPEPSLPQPSDDNQPWQHPGKALDAVATDQKDDVISPAGGYPQALSSKEPAISPVANISTHAHASPGPDDNQLTEATNEDLIHVKQEALDELFPLIDKLDQTADEHFKTLMMIIQASDNHTLIEKAFQIAQTIDDEKVRAQALLDIVNEINYFTQQPKV